MEILLGASWCFTLNIKDHLPKFVVPDWVDPSWNSMENPSKPGKRNL